MSSEHTSKTMTDSEADADYMQKLRDASPLVQLRRENERLRAAAAKVVRFQTPDEYARAIEELDAVLHGPLPSESPRRFICGVCNVPMTEVRPGEFQHAGECLPTNEDENE